MDVGKFVQFPVTPGLVQLSVFPPAVPETANVPVHAPPAVDTELNVNVPVKLVALVEPDTVPFACEVAHVPDTVEPDWLRFINTAMMYEPPLTCVAVHVPDQFFATFATDGAAGELLHADSVSRISAVESTRFIVNS